MRLAYFSPLSPQRSGIAAYSETLLPHLAAHFALDLFVDGYQPAQASIASAFPIYDWHEFAARQRERRYRTALYQMGNSTYHEYIYQTLLQWPGVTVLHDLVLHHFVSAITERRGNRAGFVREMAYAYGAAGATVARRYLRQGAGYAAPDYPLSRRVVDASLGVIVHSEYVRQRVLATSPAAPVAVVPALAYDDLAVPPRAEARAQLGLREETLLVASLGIVTHEKRFHIAVPAFRRFRATHPDALYVVVGEVPGWHPLPQDVANQGLAEVVQMPGYVDAPTMALYLGAADLCLNLRYPTMGETSGSLLRVLGAGLPAIVSDAGAYAEVPADCCYKLAVGDDEEDRLLEMLCHLADDPAERARLGENARRYVWAHHAPAQVAQAYAEAITALVGR